MHRDNDSGNENVIAEQSQRNINNGEAGQQSDALIISVDTSAEIPADQSNDLSLSFFSVFKRISELGIPMALSFTFSFEVFLAVLLLNYLSKTNDDIAAATLVSVLMNTICVFGMSPLFAVAIYLSGKLGEWREINENKDNSIEIANRKVRLKEVISSVNANSLLIASIVTPPALLALFFSKTLLVSVFHQNENVSDIAQTFLRVYSFAVPALMMRMSFEQIMFSFGKAKPAMWMGLANLILGVLISLSLGFGVNLGLFTIPKLGSSGVALGFVIESYLTALSYGLYIGLSREIGEFNVYKQMLTKIMNSWQTFKEILTIGGSISFTVAIELAMTLAVGVLSGLVGTKEQSAMTFNMQFVYFEFIALAAFSMSCAQELSREIGAKKYRDANRIATYGLITTLIYLSPLPVIFAISPKVLEVISGGTTDEITNILKVLVPIMSVGVIADSIRYNLLQQLRALNDLVIPNAIALAGMSSGIGLAACLAFATSLGINGVALGYSAGVGMAAAGLFIRWLYRANSDTIEQIANPDKAKSKSSLGSRNTFFKKKNLQEIDEKIPLLNQNNDTIDNVDNYTQSHRN